MSAARPVVVQLTDVHVGSRLARSGATPLGELGRVVVAVATLDRPADLVLLTGDLVDHGRPDEYDALLDVLGALPCPYVLVAGNHDDPAELARAVARRGAAPRQPQPLDRRVDLGALRVLTLDSSVPGSEAGRVGDDQCVWLDAELAADRRPTIVAVHHPPVAIGHAGLDGMRLTDAGALGAVVASHPHVERIVCGHVHRAVTVRWCGTVVTTAPSTMRQFAPTFAAEPTFGLADEAPAFAVHVWTGDALASHVVAL